MRDADPDARETYGPVDVLVNNAALTTEARGRGVQTRGTGYSEI